jgi:hypothetical protein
MKSCNDERQGTARRIEPKQSFDVDCKNQLKFCLPMNLGTAKGRFESVTVNES